MRFDFKSVLANALSPESFKFIQLNNTDYRIWQTHLMSLGKKYAIDQQEKCK